jgi:hypothetical protein
MLYVRVLAVTAGLNVLDVHALTVHRSFQKLQQLLRASMTVWMPDITTTAATIATPSNTRSTTNAVQEWAPSTVTTGHNVSHVSGACRVVLHLELTARQFADAVRSTRAAWIKQLVPVWNYCRVLADLCRPSTASRICRRLDGVFSGGVQDRRRHELAR